ncbi:hypothetical protein lerEdw1_003689 [Lerista edwardsae]|nr:hypothetical protein lerEdw1_003689 [Lerista edwardsae]
MALMLFFLTLLSDCSGMHSQATMTQPPSMSGSLGETVELSCTRSSAGSWDDYFRWLQQRPGQAPRFVHCNGCNRGEGIPDRFTATKSGSVGSLTITNMQPEDEADYYCVNWVDAHVLEVLKMEKDDQCVPGEPTILISHHALLHASPSASDFLLRSSSEGWYAFEWYQQTAGQSPRRLFCGGSRGTGVPDRFTVSSSGANGYLTITNPQPEDEADYHCVTSQATLTQLASMSVSPGQTAELSCTKSSGDSWSSDFCWHQQKEGQAPRYVVYGCEVCGTPSTPAEGIPDRFTTSASGNVVYLIINNTQAEDEADYYCVAWENRHGFKSHSDTI